MKDIIRQVKARHPIGPFVAPHTKGLRPSGAGKWFIGYCPFHEHSYDRPNFWVNIESGLCRCFVPSCIGHGTKPMDVINFHARLRGISNQEAIQELL